jgi:hypothetical protein
MAGYIGSKSVNLSTTSADIAGDADVSGDLTVDTSTLHVDSTNNRVGVGTSSPARTLHVNSGGTNGIATFESTDSTGVVWVADGNSANTSQVGLGAVTDDMLLYAGGSEAMRLDASGNLLVGKTSGTIASQGHELRSAANGGWAGFTNDGERVAFFNRMTSDGQIAVFRKDNVDVGSIGTNSSAPYFATAVGSNLVGLKIQGGSAPRIVPTNGSGVSTDNYADLGESNARFDDIYVLSVISTSDRNEKQDIAELSDAEQRVALAAKGLMRKFRWKNRVAEKGDDARIHCGIIAQDLQAAFAAEGLDAGDYAMFISTTWWETQTEVPAVDAVAEVLDEEGNVVTEAVEAVDAYTRTDTYETQEEAPEGATERTRLGVRYSELLAFIIGAL